MSSPYRGPRRQAPTDPAELIDPDLPTVDLARERPFSRIAGVCAIGTVIATIASVPVAATDVTQKVGDPDDLDILQSIGESGTGQLLALGLRLLSVVLIAVTAVFLYRAIKGRVPAHSALVLVLGLVAFAMVAASLALGFFELRDAGRDFVGSGLPETKERAEAALDAARDGTGLQAAKWIGILGGVLFGIWISLTSVEASRAGLLTRFLGLFGIGTGITTAIGIPVSSALFLAWIGSIGILAIGYWPGGRPPGWETGQATIPWEARDAGPHAGRRGEEPI